MPAGPTTGGGALPRRTFGSSLPPLTKSGGVPGGAATQIEKKAVQSQQARTKFQARQQQSTSLGTAPGPAGASPLPTAGAPVTASPRRPTQLAALEPTKGSTGASPANLFSGALPHMSLPTDARGAMPEMELTAEQQYCVDILIEGNVQSFVDFFYLTHFDDADHQTAEQADQTSVESKPMGNIPAEQLTYLKQNLTEAERARRRGESTKVYIAYKNLAEHFESIDDFKTAVQFHQKCLEIARDNGDLFGEAQANKCLGEAHEHHGELNTAISFYEEYLSIAKRAGNEQEQHGASQHLVNAYRTQAEDCEAQGDFHQSISFLKKCADMSQLCDDSKAEALSHYHLGLAHEQLKENDKAIEYFESYFEMSVRNRDEVGQGTACSALARASTTLNNQAKSIHYLELYLDLAQRTNQLAAQAEACSNLGIMYNRQGEYTKAVQYFERNFEIARSLGDRKMLDNARIYLGIARGNAKVDSFIRVVNDDPAALLAWKNSRTPFERQQK